MHPEYATAWLPGDAEPVEPPPGAAEELLEEVLGVVVDPRCATAGPLAPPPQPATSSVSAASPPISRIAFISSSPRAGWMLRARVFYETAGYTTVTKAVTAL
jgi:DNA-binding transcriptional LysR family regulator